MGKKNKILLLTDFSLPSIQALNFVSQGYNTILNEYTLLHVNSVQSGNDPEDISLMNTKAESILKFLQKINPNSDYHSIIETGHITKILSRYISSNQYDLIVSGTKGQTNEPGNLFGGTSIHLFESSTCPVLSVSEYINYAGIKHIIYFATFGQKDFEAIKKIACMLKIFNAEITIYNSCLNYNDSYMDKVNELRETLNNKKITFLSVSKDETLDVIEVFSKHKKTDLICILANKAPGLQELFASKKSSELSYLVSIPFLIFPKEIDGPTE